MLIVHAISAVTSLFLGGFVLYKNTHSIVNRVFFVLTAGIFVWQMSMVLLFITHLFIFDKLIHYGGVITVFGIFAFSFVFPEKNTLTRNFYYRCLPLAGIALFIVPFNLLVADMTISSEGTPLPVHGPLIYNYLVILALYLYLSISQIWSKYNKSTGKTKQQIAYFLVGVGILCVTGLSFAGILPALGFPKMSSFAPLSILAFMSITAYAIVKHQLLDIRVVIQRGVIYSTLLAGIVALYISALYVFGALLGQAAQFATHISAFLTTIIGIFSVPPIDRYLRRKTDALFFKDTYHYQDAMHELSETLNRNIDRTKIIDSFSAVLTRILKSSHVTIQLRDKTTLSSAAVEKCALNMPLKLKGRRTGSLLLGEKRSGDVYSEKDKHLLRTVSWQLAMALERAELHEVVAEYSRDLEKKIAERTNELREAHEQQRQIITDISHGLQTPLTILKSEINEFKRMHSFSKDAVAFEKSINDLSAFIYDLLHLVQIESQAAETSSERINLSSLVNEMSEYMSIAAAEKDINVMCTVANDVYIFGARKKIEEALLNIMSNAIKYIGDGDNRKISIALSMLNEEAQITIADNGVGIAKEDISKIFDRFYRAKNKHSNGTKGSGLGLSIAKAIIQSHNGDIQVSSELNIGTTFTVTIPTQNTEQSFKK